MSIHGPRGELDLIAVQRDDEALDELARRQTREPMGEDVLFLLAALTVEVDAGLADLLATPLQMPLCSAATGKIPGLSDAARRRSARTVTARTVTAALIVAGFVSVSGVSAAVTGDPLTPYRSVISTINGTDPKTHAPRAAGNESVRQQVLSIDAAIDAGQFDRAHLGIKRLRATLDAKPRGADLAAIAQLAALEAKLARAEAESKKADDGPHPTLPAATGGSHTGGSGAPSQVTKPVDKPKSNPPRDKAQAPSAPRNSSAETTEPRQDDTEKPSTDRATAESEAKSGAAANNHKETRD